MELITGCLNCVELKKSLQAEKKKVSQKNCLIKLLRELIRSYEAKDLNLTLNDLSRIYESSATEVTILKQRLSLYLNENQELLQCKNEIISRNNILEKKSRDAEDELSHLRFVNKQLSEYFREKEADITKDKDRLKKLAKKLLDYEPKNSEARKILGHTNSPIEVNAKPPKPGSKKKAEKDLKALKKTNMQIDESQAIESQVSEGLNLDDEMLSSSDSDDDLIDSTSINRAECSNNPSLVTLSNSHIDGNNTNIIAEASKDDLTRLNPLENQCKNINSKITSERSNDSSKSNQSDLFHKNIGDIVINKESMDKEGIVPTNNCFMNEVDASYNDSNVFVNRDEPVTSEVNTVHEDSNDFINQDFEFECSLPNLISPLKSDESRSAGSILSCEKSTPHIDVIPETIVIDDKGAEDCDDNNIKNECSSNCTDQVDRSKKLPTVSSKYTQLTNGLDFNGKSIGQSCPSTAERYLPSYQFKAPPCMGCCNDAFASKPPIILKLYNCSNMEISIPQSIEKQDLPVITVRDKNSSKNIQKFTNMSDISSKSTEPSTTKTIWGSWRSNNHATSSALQPCDMYYSKSSLNLTVNSKVPLQHSREDYSKSENTDHYFLDYLSRNKTIIKNTTFGQRSVAPNEIVECGRLFPHHTYKQFDLEQFCYSFRSLTLSCTIIQPTTFKFGCLSKAPPSNQQYSTLFNISNTPSFHNALREASSSKTVSDEWVFGQNRNIASNRAQQNADSKVNLKSSNLFSSKSDNNISNLTKKNSDEMTTSQSAKVYNCNSVKKTIMRCDLDGKNESRTTKRSFESVCPDILPENNIPNKVAILESRFQILEDEFHPLSILSTSSKASIPKVFPNKPVFEANQKRNESSTSPIPRNSVQKEIISNKSPNLSQEKKLSSPSENGSSEIQLYSLTNKECTKPIFDSNQKNKASTPQGKMMAGRFVKSPENNKKENSHRSQTLSQEKNFLSSATKKLNTLEIESSLLLKECAKPIYDKKNVTPPGKVNGGKFQALPQEKDFSSPTGKNPPEMESSHVQDEGCTKSIFDLNRKKNVTGQEKVIGVRFVKSSENNDRENCLKSQALHQEKDFSSPTRKNPTEMESYHVQDKGCTKSIFDLNHKKNVTLLGKDIGGSLAKSSENNNKGNNLKSQAMSQEKDFSSPTGKNLPEIESSHIQDIGCTKSITDLNNKRNVAPIEKVIDGSFVKSSQNNDKVNSQALGQEKDFSSAIGKNPPGIKSSHVNDKEYTKSIFDMNQKKIGIPKTSLVCAKISNVYESETFSVDDLIQTQSNNLKSCSSSKENSPSPPKKLPAVEKMSTRLRARRCSKHIFDPIQNNDIESTELVATSDGQGQKLINGRSASQDENLLSSTKKALETNAHIPERECTKLGDSKFVPISPTLGNGILEPCSEKSSAKKTHLVSNMKSPHHILQKECTEKPVFDLNRKNNVLSTNSLSLENSNQKKKDSESYDLLQEEFPFIKTKKHSDLQPKTTPLTIRDYDRKSTFELNHKNNGLPTSILSLENCDQKKKDSESCDLPQEEFPSIKTKKRTALHPKRPHLPIRECAGKSAFDLTHENNVSVTGSLTSEKRGQKKNDPESEDLSKEEFPLVKTKKRTALQPKTPHLPVRAINTRSQAKKNSSVMNQLSNEKTSTQKDDDGKNFKTPNSATEKNLSKTNAKSMKKENIKKASVGKIGKDKSKCISVTNKKIKIVNNELPDSEMDTGDDNPFSSDCLASNSNSNGITSPIAFNNKEIKSLATRPNFEPINGCNNLNDKEDINLDEELYNIFMEIQNLIPVPMISPIASPEIFLEEVATHPYELIKKNLKEDKCLKKYTDLDNPKYVPSPPDFSPETKVVQKPKEVSTNFNSPNKEDELFQCEISKIKSPAKDGECLSISSKSIELSMYNIFSDKDNAISITNDLKGDECLVKSTDLVHPQYVSSSLDFTPETKVAQKLKEDKCLRKYTDLDNPKYVPSPPDFSPETKVVQKPKKVSTNFNSPNKEDELFQCEISKIKSPAKDGECLSISSKPIELSMYKIFSDNDNAISITNDFKEDECLVKSTDLDHPQFVSSSLDFTPETKVAQKLKEDKCLKKYTDLDNPKYVPSPPDFSPETKVVQKPKEVSTNFNSPNKEDELFQCKISKIKSPMKDGECLSISSKPIELSMYNIFSDNDEALSITNDFKEDLDHENYVPSSLDFTTETKATQKLKEDDLFQCEIGEIKIPMKDEECISISSKPAELRKNNIFLDNDDAIISITNDFKEDTDLDQPKDVPLSPDYLPDDLFQCEMEKFKIPIKDEECISKSPKHVKLRMYNIFSDEDDINIESPLVKDNHVSEIEVKTNKEIETTMKAKVIRKYKRNKLPKVNNVVKSEASYSLQEEMEPQINQAKQLNMNIDSIGEVRKKEFTIMDDKSNDFKPDKNKTCSPVPVDMDKCEMNSSGSKPRISMGFYVNRVEIESTDDESIMNNSILSIEEDKQFSDISRDVNVTDTSDQVSFPTICHASGCDPFKTDYEQEEPQRSPGKNNFNKRKQTDETPEEERGPSKKPKTLTVDDGFVLCEDNVFISALKYFSKLVVKQKDPDFSHVKNENLPTKIAIHHIKNLISSALISTDTDIYATVNNTVEKIKQVNLASASTLAKAIIEIITEANNREEEVKNKPCMPSMTRTVKFSLLIAVSFIGYNRDYVMKFLDVFELFLSSFDDKTLSFEEGTRLTVFYTSFCRSYNLDFKVKHFIYDVLYTRSLKAYPMVLKVMHTWPDVIPDAKTCASKDCLLTQAIIFLLLSGTCTTDPKFSKFLSPDAIRSNLQKYFGYKCGDIRKDVLVHKIIDNIAVKGSSLALVLLCKCEPWSWSYSIIEKKLLPILQSYKASEMSELVICEYVITLARILRALPITKASPLFNTVLELLQEMLHNSNSDYFSEIIIEAICLLRRHNLMKCASVLMGYKPNTKQVTKKSMEHIKSILQVKNILDWRNIYSLNNPLGYQNTRKCRNQKKILMLPNY